VITAAVSNQINILDVRIISIIPIGIMHLREMQISPLNESDLAEILNLSELPSGFSQNLQKKIKKQTENQFPIFKRYGIWLAILLLGGLTGKLMMTLIHAINLR
jgi:hypothetical protein